MTDEAAPHVVPSGGGSDYDWAQDHVFVKSPLELTQGRVTVVEDRLKAGFHLGRHHHRKVVEIFHVLDGEVRFVFDDSSVLAIPGTTITVPQGAWHEVMCLNGGRLITVFTPGGFDHYLAELDAMDPAELENAGAMRRLSELYDIWTSPLSDPDGPSPPRPQGPRPSAMVSSQSPSNPPCP